MAGRREQPRPQAAPIACDFESCGEAAIARVPGVAGMANVCKQHYSFLAQREAELFCDAQGLSSAADKLAFCRVKMKEFGRGGDFDSWVKTVSQRTVAVLVQSGNVRLLERLRRAGVIDAYNRMVKSA